MSTAYAPEKARTYSGVKVRSVVCAECLADIDQPCHSSTGRQMPGYHATRRRMATRKWNEEVDHKAVAWVARLSTEQRAVIRRAAGLTQEALERALGIGDSCVVDYEKGQRLTGPNGIRYCEWLEAQPREMTATARHVETGMILLVDSAWCKVVTRTLVGPLVVLTVFGGITGMQTFTLDPKEEVRVRFE
jgi:DNA-binding transcriptional regulator YiaG